MSLFATTNYMRRVKDYSLSLPYTYNSRECLWRQQLSSSFKVFICQMMVTKNKLENIEKAVDAIKLAASIGSNLVVLPEFFNSPYGTKYFQEYSEEISEKGYTCQSISKAAKSNNIYVVAGSIPEKSGEKYYNTCVIFNNYGNIVDKYRKINLFKIDLPAIKFDESDIISKGDKLVTFDVPILDRTVKIGLLICFDIRFPELAQSYREMDVDVLVCPAAFSMVTGPIHWQLLGRTRAVDSQMFTVLVSPARDTKAEYVTYGHSLVSDPMGTVVHEFGDEEACQMVTLDLDLVSKTRRQIPVGRLPNVESLM